jgi:hypothetical protein
MFNIATRIVHSNNQFKINRSLWILSIKNPNFSLFFRIKNIEYMGVNEVSCLCLPNFLNKFSNPKRLFLSPNVSVHATKCGSLTVEEGCCFSFFPQSLDRKFPSKSIPHLELRSNFSSTDFLLTPSFGNWTRELAGTVSSGFLLLGWKRKRGSKYSMCNHSWWAYSQRGLDSRHGIVLQSGFIV